MSDSQLLTKEDLATLEKEINDTKKKINTTLNEEQQEVLRETIRKELEEELRKKKEQEEEKKRQEAQEAIKKADQEAQLSRLKSLEDKYAKLVEQQGGASQGTPSGSPYDPPKKDFDDYTNEELQEIDGNSMKVFFDKKEGLKF